MYIHVMVMKFKKETPPAIIANMKAALEKFPGVIPGLQKACVGIDSLRTPNSGDIAAFFIFDSKADQEAFQTNPVHVAARAPTGPYVAERTVVDYEA